MTGEGVGEGGYVCGFVGVLLPDDFGKACDPRQKRNDKGSSFTAAWEGRGMWRGKGMRGEGGGG